MIKCVGYQFKTGTFNEEKTGRVVAYDNVCLFYTSNINPDVNGLEAGTLKIKRDQFSKVCSVPVQDLVGKEIHVEYQPVGGKLVISSIIIVK